MDIQAFLVEADARIDRANINEINEFLIELDNIIEEQKDTYVLCKLYYVKANHLSVLKEIRIIEDRHTLVEIGALETIHEQIIYSFRKSLSLSEEDDRIELEFKEMIITNLANEINHVGRFVEALDLWDSVETILNRSFPMAIGNMGLGITTYASYLYDQGHRHYLYREAFYRLHYAIDFKEYLPN
ncbi:hypothetical protein [Bacillus paramycoides]|uniref:Uncharacterized protein n=1 Tax=Bacillus paramycoides TaxID=2026194 RepID=A0ABU6MNF3_9BACI|nr:hypothetical protein [Bacillus paramycoides]MED1108108.1 hypothetical protein [Bacillus paramycoides]MED1564387.1 hypothetical protein [Bacillus paramycoides]